MSEHSAGQTGPSPANAEHQQRHKAAQDGAGAECAGQQSDRVSQAGAGEVLVRWDLRVEPDGRLSAVLTGTNPPLTVSGDDLASLRKQIRTMIMRALL